MNSRIVAVRFFPLARRVVPSRPVCSPRFFSSYRLLCAGDRSTNPHFWSEEVANSTPHDAGPIVEAISQQSNLPDAVLQQTDLAASGLGGYTPVGIIQHALEFLHVQADVPWWLAIATTAAFLRLALLPLAVSMQQNTARMFNIQPEVSRILLNMQQCSKNGDQVGQAQEGLKLADLYRQHRVNPFKMFFMPLVQMPIFLTFFMAIRRMAAAPVESMKTGGLGWFPDLTIPDPTFSLPLLTCVNFLINIELGGETAASNPTYETTKKILRIGTIAILPITAALPSGLFMYMITTSVLTTVQILLFKQPAVRRLFRIPLLRREPPLTQTKM